MQIIRPVVATDPRRFGRGICRELEAPAAPGGLSEDFRLFVVTFLAGFAFVSVLIA
jgi:hypothetical protein